MSILSLLTKKREPNPESIQDDILGLLHWHGKEWVSELELEDAPCSKKLLTVRILAGKDGPSQSHKEQFIAAKKSLEAAVANLMEALPKMAPYLQIDSIENLKSRCDYASIELDGNTQTDGEWNWTLSLQFQDNPHEGYFIDFVGDRPLKVDRVG